MAKYLRNARLVFEVSEAETKFSLLSMIGVGTCSLRL